MNNLDKQYKERLKKLIEYGTISNDRTGTGCTYILGLEPIRVNMNEGFPCSTLRRLGFNNQVRELLWFIKGHTNLNSLHPSVHKWWKPFANEDGSFGRSYGEQLRRSKRVLNNTPVQYDQLQSLIDQIVKSPNSRRLCASTWDSHDMQYTSLPCCHGSMIQFAVDGNRLSLTTYNRSQDFILGTPHNIILYSLLLHIVANLTGLEPYEYIHQFGHAHVYLDHIEQAVKLLDIEANELPVIAIDHKQSIMEYNDVDFKLIDYKPIEGDWNFKLSV